MSAGSSTAGGGAAAGSGGMGNADPESHYGHDGVSQLWVGRGKSGVSLPRLPAEANQRSFVMGSGFVAACCGFVCVVVGRCGPAYTV